MWGAFAGAYNRQTVLSMPCQPREAETCRKVFLQIGPQMSRSMLTIAGVAPVARFFIPTDLLQNPADTMLSLRQARERLPGRPAISTITRWASVGVNGVRLRLVRVGGRCFVAESELLRFVAACTEGAVGMTPGALSSLQTDPVAFRDYLRLDGGQPFVRDGWQESAFLAVDPGWQRAIGRQASGGYSRAWFIRPRGHSKTFDIAAMIVWALFSAGHAVRGVVAAGDQDQARLVADAVRALVRANPWLSDFIDVQRNRIINPHSEAECIILP